MTGFLAVFLYYLGYIFVRLSATLWNASTIRSPDLALTSLNTKFLLLQNFYASSVLTLRNYSGESSLLPNMNSCTLGMAYFYI